MIRELFHIGSFSISPFGVLLVLAFFSAYWQLRRGLVQLGVGDEEDASAVLFAGGLGGILGGKLYYAALYKDWHLIFDRAGIVWYGSFFLGLAAVLWTIHRRRLPFARTMDAATVALALGYSVGRIGCFLVGDDYGKPTDLPWGLTFKEGLPPTTAGNLRSQFGVDLPPEMSSDTWVAVHPTQLYETFLALCIWLVGCRLLGRPLRAGSTALAMLAMLAVERFGIEFLRAKDDRFFGEITLAQIFSLALLAGVGWIAWRRRGGSPPPAGGSEEPSLPEAPSLAEGGAD